MKKIFPWIVVIVAFLLVALSLVLYFVLIINKDRTSLSITNFTDCETADYPIGESYPRQCFTPDGKSFTEIIDNNTSIQPVTLTGEIACLPKISSGPQTLECAIGLKTHDSEYYGLKNLSDLDPELKFSTDGLQVVITGTLSQEQMQGPDGNNYDIEGVITLSSIKEI